MSRANPRYRRLNAPGLPLLAGNAIGRYIIQGTLNNQMTINSLDFFAAAPSLSTTSLSTLLGAISTALFAKYKACLSTDWVCVRELFNIIHRNDIVGALTTLNAGATGTIASPSFDSEIAITIQKKTILKGQHGRGRMSLPAVPTNAVSESVVNGAALLANLNAFTAQLTMTASDGVATWTSCVSTRAANPPRLANGYELILNAQFNTLLGTVRRRKIGRGK